MKKLLALCAILLAYHTSYAQDIPERTAFSNLGISLNGSTSGIGVTLSTPLSKRFVLRGGYQFSFLSYKHRYDFEPIDVDGEVIFTMPDITLSAKMNSDAAHMMVDWIPFKKGTGTFFVSAGFFVSRSDVLTGYGQLDMNDPAIKDLEEDGLLQDLEIDFGENAVYIGTDGRMDATMMVNKFRPYVGIGWGRAIPKHRVGFRFELGTIFMGRPEITSPNLRSGTVGGESCKIKNLKRMFTTFPQMSFQLTYKVFKDK